MKVFTTIISCLLFINLFAQEDLPSNYSYYNDLLYGVVYEPVNYNSIGHPFYLKDKIYQANLHFDGNTYKNVSLKYDLYNQKIVLYQDYNSSKYRFIELNINLVDSFELIDENSNVHYFLPQSAFKNLNSNIKFVELIYKNKICYIVGRKKTFTELAQELKNKFYEKNSNYIIIHNNLILIDSKGDILNVFEDHKKDIKRFIRRNKIKIKEIKSTDLLRIIKYYESLMN